jgi:glycine hydroxymethyltransferase
MTGNDAQNLLERGNITVNKNTVPGETRSPFQASGLRLGTPAVTTRGMKEAEMVQIADLIAAILGGSGDGNAINSAKKVAQEICSRFPLPYR